MISDEDDGINSRAYRLNKNSKKLLKQLSKEQAETSEGGQYRRFSMIDIQKKPNSDLSDYNKF